MARFRTAQRQVGRQLCWSSSTRPSTGTRPITVRPAISSPRPCSPQSTSHEQEACSANTGKTRSGNAAPMNGAA